MIQSSTQRPLRSPAATMDFESAVFPLSASDVGDQKGIYSCHGNLQMGQHLWRITALGALHKLHKSRSCCPRSEQWSFTTLLQKLLAPKRRLAFCRFRQAWKTWEPACLIKSLEWFKRSTCWKRTSLLTKFTYMCTLSMFSSIGLRLLVKLVQRGNYEGPCWSSGGACKGQTLWCMLHWNGITRKWNLAKQTLKQEGW